MLKLLSSSILLLFLSGASGQFFYNYEDEGSAEPPPQYEGYDPSQYQYNPPSAVNQQFLKPVQQNVQTPRQVVRSRTQGRSVSRRYEPHIEPVMDYNPEPKMQMDDQPEPEPVQEQRMDYHQERRTSRRRSRVRYTTDPPTNPPRVNSVPTNPPRVYSLPTNPPRVYSPSVFENIGLGQAPSGVYVPQDSLLNILKNPAYRSQALVPYSMPVQPQSQPTRRQSAVNYHSDDTPTFFVQPPTDEDYYRQQNVVGPVNQYQSNQQYVSPVVPSRQYVPPVSNTRSTRNQPSQQQQPPVQASQTSRRQRQRSQPQPEYRYGAESAPANDINADDVFEDDLVRARPPVRPQRRNNDQAVSAPRSNARSQPATSAPQARQRPTFKPAKLAIAELPADTDEDGIPGEAGVNYPTLHVIPDTTFSCAQQQHNGYYADLETSCQVVHLCQAGGVKDSFLCPNGTIFSQEKFACQWWYKVNCAESPRYYGINDSLYKVPPPPSRSRN